MDETRGAVVRGRERAFAVAVVLAVLAVLAVLGGGVASATGSSAEPRAATTADRGPYAWPLAPAPVVVRPFQEPTHRYGPGHRGVDLGAAPGAAVLAAAAGVVVFAGALAGRGVVSLQHPDGLRTTYEPVDPLVEAGAHIARGAVLGTLEPGHLGCPTACLHWGVRRDRTTYLDPLLLLRPPRVRLLPVPDPWPDGAVPAAKGWLTPGDGPGRGPPSDARR